MPLIRQTANTATLAKKWDGEKIARITASTYEFQIRTITGSFTPQRFVPTVEDDVEFLNCSYRFMRDNDDEYPWENWVVYDKYDNPVETLTDEHVHQTFYVRGYHPFRLKKNGGTDTISAAISFY
jgi:hypothetical protein